MKMMNFGILSSSLNAFIISLCICASVDLLLEPADGNHLVKLKFSNRDSFVILSAAALIFCDANVGHRSRKKESPTTHASSNALMFSEKE